MANVTKQQIEQYRAAIQSALDAVAKEHDMEAIQLGNIRYNELGFRSKVEATFQKDESLAKTEMDVIAGQLKYLGICPSFAERIFIFQGVEFLKITRVKQKNVLAEGSDGKTYNIRISALQSTFPA